MPCEPSHRQFSPPALHTKNYEVELKMLNTVDYMMQQFTRLTLLLTIIMFLIAGCEKVRDDKIPPVLILKGPDPFVTFPGCPYSDPGYVLVDDRTPPDMITVTNNSDEINTDSTGVYYVQYTATDADGNIALAQRKVIIEQLSLGFFSGKMNAADTLKPLNQVNDPYQVTCEVFNTELSWIRIFNFNNFGDNFKVIMIPDTQGNLELTYALSDTLISGYGSTYCNKSGFRLEYTVETPDDGISIHHVTYTFD